ncbi:predicted protein [Scheffersomyces stipitis CBS 6054]|uniref:PCI domain-containing protein n=1 Tax=Scheffersomyces stipitis (strain ATCC 58785 / CBS 6054 / NBRC 10063 / NRRL Y-11545) TaxID=322104 RepID=A3LU02_PICST|nr:predicted protein [Scheffersomyces stipitis CBS 6054]ABN66500.2 predicted protein [Scheffersomyces stipitis CBS 6054]KAG2732720.1 hypothetical protein G9P44_003710 [Scheffersomyces stipitis]
MSLQKLTAELYSSFERGDYSQCQNILPPIKIELIKHNLLVPVASNSQTKDQVNDLKIAQRILEIGALSSLLSNNYQSFENFVAQLKPFYANIQLHPSSKKHANSDATKIKSLYLLYLLSQGLISKFHTELEVIYNSNHDDIENDKYLQFPINLERNLMEGNYNKIWKLLKEDKNLPCQEFAHFIDTLIQALRFEIAKSIEKTYESIPINNCKNLLYFPQEQSDAVFEKELSEELEVENWKFENGIIYFDKNETVLNADNSNVIHNVLNYAEQIDSII